MPLDNFDNSTIDDSIAALDDRIARLQQVNDHLVNSSGFGIGSTLPTSIQAGSQVLPVSNVSATVIGSVGSASKVCVRWIEPPDASSGQIDRYNVYVQGLFSQQTQEVLVASAHTSPATFTVLPDGPNSVQVFVQTVLKNGQTIPIPSCPATSVKLNNPKGTFRGVVTMFHDTPTTWLVSLPDGTIMNTSSSTTDGLQEAITYATANGYNLWVLGGPFVDYRKVTCTTAITVPPLQGFEWHMQAVNLWFTGLATVNFITVDSCDQTLFRWGSSQIVHSGTGAGNGVTLLFKPTGNNGEDFVGITSSTFELGVVVPANGLGGVPDGTRGYGVVLDSSVYTPGHANGSGLIVNNTFSAAEINGGIYGIHVVDPDSHNSFKSNTMVFPSIHTQGTWAITVGTSAAAAELILLNKWKVTTDSPVSTWGGHSTNGGDSWDIQSSSSMTLQDKARGQKIDTASNKLGFTITNNSSFPSENWITQVGNQLTVAGVTVGGSPWPYQNQDSRIETLIVQGGVVSKIELSGDGGTFYDTGSTFGAWTLLPGQTLRITYTVAPTVTKMYK